MSISLSRYVDITSGLGASSLVPNRDLVARFITSNVLLPPLTFLSFSTAKDVGDYFGISSEEYLRAVFYFSWISKSLTQPASIQYARWVNTSVAPRIYPIVDNATALASWTPITSGSLILTMGSFTYTLSSLDFSGAANLAAVATIMTNAIVAQTGGGTLWTSATVTYDTTTGGFILVGGVAPTEMQGTFAINVQVGGGGTDITRKGLLGWLPTTVYTNGTFSPSDGSIFSIGSYQETVTQTLTNTAEVSNNFGSFAFLTNLNISNTDIVSAANWNNSQNFLYLYSQAVTPSNASTLQALVESIGGIALTLSPPITLQVTGTLTSTSNQITALSSTSGLSVGMTVSDGGVDIPAGTVITSVVNATTITISNAATGSATELLTFGTLQFPEMAPMMVEAATDYDGTNTVQNYEFQQFAGLTPSVTDDTDADSYDNLSINYYGQTATAGTQIAFYQTGVLMGNLSTSVTDMTAYVNEIWLKDAASVAIMNLLLASTQIPANNQGRNQILAILQGVINQALNNGTISIGKTLTTAQQMYITSATGDPLAWYQVQNSGYWVDVVITGSGTPTVYTATYTLIYSKDDVIRKVIGTHTLI